MTPDERTTKEDDLASILAACDEALADGDLPQFPNLGDELTPEQARLVNDIECVRLLRDVWANDRPAAKKPVKPIEALTHLGRFQIVKELGRGGFGIVYLAYDPQLARPFALKIPRPDVKLTDQLRGRFRNEAKAAGGLDHPNLIPVYDAGEIDGTSYIATAYCAGPSLAAWLKQRTEPVGVKEAADLVAQLADGVEHAHQRSVLHRDLKPSNVLLWAPPEGGAPIPKLTDFGLAKNLLVDGDLTATGAIVGTPNYLAPEQAESRGAVIGPAVDVYGLGAILYELLTRRPPFESDSVLETLRLVRTEDPISVRKLRTQIPIDLETICLKCLEKEPSRRYPSAAALSEELRRYLEGKPILARPPSLMGRTAKWVRRRPTIAALLAGIAILLCVAAGLAVATIANLDEARKQAGIVAEQAGVVADQERDAHHKEQIAREKEAKAKEESQRNLARFRVAEGGRRLDAGDLAGGAVWFAAALESELDPDAREIHRIRLAASLRTSPRPLRLFTPLLQNTPGSADSFAADGSVYLTSLRERPELWSTSTGEAVSARPPDGEIFGELGVSSDGSAIIGSFNSYSARAWNVKTQEPLLLPAKGAGFRTPFSPDGGLVLYRGTDSKVLTLSNSITGKPVGSSMRLPFGALYARFTPDGRRLVVNTRGGSEAYLFDTSTGLAVGTPLKHNSFVSNFAFSPDGTRVATMSSDRTVQVWDAETGKAVGPRLLHNAVVTIAVFGNDRKLVTAGTDRHARLWSSETGALLALSPAHTGTVTAAAYSPDGKTIATAGDDGATLLWDAATGESLSPNLMGTVAVKWLFFSRDGHELVVVGTNGRVRVWEVALKGGPVRFSVRGVLLRARWNPDGSSVLVTTTAAAEIRTPAGALLHRLPLKFPIGDAVFGAGGRVVSAEPGGIVRVWDASSGSPIGKPMKHPATVLSILLSPDGQRVFSAADDGVLRFWDSTTGEPTGLEVKAPGVLANVAFSPDNRMILASIPGNNVSLWDAGTGRALGSLSLGEAMSWSAFSGDGKRLVLASYRGAAQVWDAETLKPIGTRIRNGLGISQAELNPDGRLLAAGGADRAARVWDVATGLAVSLPMQHDREIIRTVFSPDGRLVATGSEDRTARVWEASTGHPVTPPLRHSGAVVRVAFSPDSRSLLTAQSDGSVFVWDLTPDMSPISELVERARFLSGRRLDDRGALVSLEDVEERALVEQFRKR